MAEGLQESGDEGHAQAAYLSISARAAGTNINPQTLLATDYLNHFNEIVMLLDMIPDMADCLEDAQAWAPCSYPDHFRKSQFRDRDLAVEAYEYVPLRYREPFDDVIGHMNLVVAAAVDKIAAAVAAGQDGELRLLCADASRTLQKMADIASAIIHGSERRLDQAEIDGFLAI